MGTVNSGLLPTFMIEGNATLQLEVNENKDGILFSSKFMDSWILVDCPLIKV